VNLKLFFFLPHLVVLFLSAKDAAAKDPIVDLTRVDFNQSGIYPISGHWQFYWNRLLTPEDFIQKKQEGELIPVPGAWNRQLEYPGLGFATYRIKIKLANHVDGLAIYFPGINSAAKIWINGEKIMESGSATADKKFYRSNLTDIVMIVPLTTEDIDLIVQVVNYTSFTGGVSGTPMIGKISELMSWLNRTQGVENFLAGSLIAMFIYQLILYSLFHRGKPYLWLALICLGVAMRALIVHGGSFLLPNLFPPVPWEIWKKIEFVSVYSIVAFFPLYISNLFKNEAPQWPVKFFVIISFFFCLMVLVSPHYVYGKLLDIAHVALLLAFIYALYSAWKASNSGNKDARIIFVGILVSFPFIAAEMVKNSLLHSLNIQLLHLVEIGVLVFLLFQVYLLANHYANSYKNLEQLNQNLEKMIDERTGQLTTANRVKDRLLSVVSHDIKSPLNSLRGILTIYNKGVISAEDFKYYSKRIEGDLTKTGLLVDNILYWTVSQLKGSTIKFEEFAVKDVVMENIELFQTIASNKKLSVKTKMTKSHVVNFDRNILNLTIRNLISNAIKFSNEGSEIIIYCEQLEEALSISVIDFGVGMSRAVLDSLQNYSETRSSMGTNKEKGTGLGLSFCREYLQMAGGKLQIESTPGNGSTFTIFVPQKISLPQSLPYSIAV